MKQNEIENVLTIGFDVKIDLILLVFILMVLSMLLSWLSSSSFLSSYMSMCFQKGYPLKCSFKVAKLQSLLCRSARFFVLICSCTLHASLWVSGRFQVQLCNFVVSVTVWKDQSDSRVFFAACNIFASMKKNRVIDNPYCWWSKEIVQPSQSIPSG